MRTKKTTSKSKAKSVKVITEDDIRTRAQEIYENRVENRIDGDSISDWAQAEKELGVPKQQD